MRPDRTLVIDMGPISRGFVQHPERYPAGLVVEWAGGDLPEDTVRDWIAGLDVVYSCETFYDWRVVDWCRESRVATVLHAMPEFYRPIAVADCPVPDETWLPTPWREVVVAQ